MGEYAFSNCESIDEIFIPKAIRAIKDNAFDGCTGMRTVTLGDGLEEIGKEAFGKCTSLQYILIPPTVKTIDDTAFKDCSNLTSVKFCEEIEEFVACEAMQHWWNQGVHERSLSTYRFFVECSIPKRLGLIRVLRWRANIYDMLRRIPTIRPKGMESYFNSIDSRLSFYEDLKDTPALLELAIWKSEISKRFGQSTVLLTTEIKMGRRTDSISMVKIIVPNVMSFLTDCDDSNCVVGDLSDEEDEDDEEDSDWRYWEEEDEDDVDDNN